MEPQITRNARNDAEFLEMSSFLFLRFSASSAEKTFQDENLILH